MKPSFRLRTLLIGVILICIFLGVVIVWYCAQEAEYQREQQVAQQIEKLGGTVIWESELPNWLVWLHKGQYSNAFQRVTFVDAHWRAISRENALAILDEIPKLLAVRGISVKVIPTSDDIDHFTQIRPPQTLFFNFEVEGFEASQQDLADQMTSIRDRLPGVLVDVDYSFP